MEEENTRRYVEKLVEQQYGIAPHACKVIGEGGAGKVYQLSIQKEPYELCVKLYKSASLNEQEAFDLEFLKPHSPIPFPQVYFTSDATEEIPLNTIALEVMDGVSAMNRIFYFASRKKRNASAEKITDALLQIHKIKSSKFGDLRAPAYSAWNDYYYPHAKEVLEKTRESAKKGEVKAHHLAMMELAFSHFDDIFCEQVKEATLIHGDFFVANILVDPKTLLPTAFLDPYGSMWADVEYELFALNNVNSGCFRLYEHYQAKARLSEMCDIKCAFYALFKEFMWYHVYGAKNDDFINLLCKRMKKQLKLYKMF